METIIKTVEKVFPNLPETFSIWDLVTLTRQRSGRPFVTDGTVTRQLRRLRERGVINYEIKNRNKAIYKKKS